MEGGCVGKRLYLGFLSILLRGRLEMCGQEGICGETAAERSKHSPHRGSGAHAWEKVDNQWTTMYRKTQVNDMYLASEC